MLFILIVFMICFMVIAIMASINISISVWSRIEDDILDYIERKIKRKTFSADKIRKEVMRGRMKVMLKLERNEKLGVYLEDDNSIERLDIFEINSWIKNG